MPRSQARLLRAAQPGGTPHRQHLSLRAAARILEVHGRAEEIADSGIAVGLFIVPRTDRTGLSKNAPTDVRQAAPPALAPHRGSRAETRVTRLDRRGRQRGG